MTRSTPLDELCRCTAAAVRGVSRSADILVSFGDIGPDSGRLVRLPRPPRHIDGKGAAVLRGEADRAAVLHRFRDPELHSRMAPAAPAAAEIYNLLEQVRCEALGAEELPGTALNIAEALNHRFTLLRIPKQLPLGEPLAAEGIGVLLRRLTFLPDLPATAGALLNAVLPALRPSVTQRIASLALLIHDQAAFAHESRQVALNLVQEDGREQQTATLQVPLKDPGAPRRQVSGPEANSTEEEAGANGEKQQASLFIAGDLKAAQDPDSAEDPSEGLEAKFAAQGARLLVKSPTNERPEYRVYTRDFDRMVAAESLCDADDLRELRAQLDERMAGMQGGIARLANRLQARLLALRRRTWTRDLDHGELDTSRLTRAIVDPIAPLAYRQDHDAEDKDTVVTLLLDNSASMRGQPIAVAATTADVLARAMERCGVRVEILGFTTGSWKGGQVRERWKRDGMPSQPGRLNDLLHIIYKDADTPWRRARRNLGLMLKDSLLKENIDGEALLWAFERLLKRPEDRRILMIISDGMPVDDSTLAANTPKYLEYHLRDAIKRIETASPIEVLAIGIGHDVTSFYRRAVTIHESLQLGHAIITQLAMLFEAPQRSRRTRSTGGRKRHPGTGAPAAQLTY